MEIMPCKTFLISLKKATDRRRRLLRDLERSGLEFEIFDAVNGYELTDKEIKENCIVSEIEKNKSWFTKGMIGAALSHYKIYKKIIEEDLPYAFIVEDDAKLSKDVRQVLESSLQHVKENEIILFYYQSIGGACKISKMDSQKLTGKYSLYYPLVRQNFVAAGAYLITQVACRELVNNIFPIRVAPDDWSYFLHHGVASARFVYPKPVETYDFRSNISSLSNFSNKTLFSRILEIVHKKKIFPFYQVMALRRGYVKRKVHGNFIFVDERSVINQ